MKDFYSILGVAKSATDDEIKKAYRKAASKKHPDKGGSKEEFQELQEAYDTLGDAKKRAAYDNPNVFTGHGKEAHFTDMNEIMRKMREAHEQNMVQFIGLRISIVKAYEGGKIALNAYGQSISYNLRPGMPQSASFLDEIPVGDRNRRINLELLIDAGNFKFVRVGSEDGVHFSGDLVTEVKVDALTLMLGGYIVVEDFLGKQLQVRVPAGFDLETRLKIAKHGYSNWKADKADGRGDMYLKIVPEFKAFKDYDEARLQELIATAKIQLELKAKDNNAST